MDLTWIDKVLGSGIPYITYAVPIFFLLIFVELGVAWWENRQVYRLNDSINDLSCGITEQIIGIFLKGLLFAGYLGTYAFVTNRGINLIDVTSYTASGKLLAALVLFLGVDLAYYWFHRIAHELNAPWAGHVVHHSSEEYNLAVALRQGAFQGVFSWVFYLPLALLGFPPLWFAAMSSFDTLYQFWIHTRVIDKLGPLEWVLNTPSHHRVHHARNPQYLDKNYAGTLIIWDRMFGTFAQEVEEPVYGLTKPLNSWNPLWANLHVWVELFRDAYLAPRWRDKFLIWIMPQGWRPVGLPEGSRAPRVTPQTVRLYDARATLGVHLYIFAHFVLALVVAVGVLVMARSKPGAGRFVLLPVALLVIWSLVNVGGMFERRRWVFSAELARLAALATWALSILPVRNEAGAINLLVIGGVLLAAAGSVAWLWKVRVQFDGRALEPGRVLTSLPEVAAAEPELAPAGLATAET
jgi:sterol desaturase/sphingolipid hydroxylase (fatty acid hydroxylase superfamily)